MNGGEGIVNRPGEDGDTVREVVSVWLSTKDKKWSLALGMKRQKSQSWGEKTFFRFLQYVPR